MNEDRELIPLSPCPFCGGDAHFYAFRSERFDKGLRVLENTNPNMNDYTGCHECVIRFQGSREESAERWNNRTDESHRRLREIVGEALKQWDKGVDGQGSPVGMVTAMLRLESEFTSSPT